MVDDKDFTCLRSQFGKKCEAPQGQVINQKEGTVGYKIAENPNELKSAPLKDYKDGIERDYTFKDPTPGKKFIFVEFISSTGQTVQKQAQIEIIKAPISAPIY